MTHQFNYYNISITCLFCWFPFCFRCWIPFCKVPINLNRCKLQLVLERWKLLTAPHNMRNGKKYIKMLIYTEYLMMFIREFIHLVAWLFWEIKLLIPLGDCYTLVIVQELNEGNLPKHWVNSCTLLDVKSQLHNTNNWSLLCLILADFWLSMCDLQG